MDSYRERGLRNRLVNQLRIKGITDERTLAAIGRVPRHMFFDPALLSHAYEDKAFPIGEGQTISQPYTVAFQTEKLGAQPGEKTLEVGTGSGYQACILLELGATVYTIEFHRPLFERASRLLPQMGYRPYFFCGDGSKGLPLKAPFHKIIVTAGCPAVPPALADQLAEGGVMVIPVGERRQQQMKRICKVGGRLEEESFNNFSFVPLLGERGWESVLSPKKHGG